MYLPVHFEVSDQADLYAFIRAHPLGLLVSSGVDGLVSDAVPFMLDDKPGQPAVLKTHFARANPHWSIIQDTRRAHVIFLVNGSYVSPGWYPSKLETGRVVPTWNYAMVEVRGTAQIRDDPEWLLEMVSRLSEVHEARVGGNWQTGDMPTDFLEAQLRGIVGMEVTVESLRGKFKLSQNRPQADRSGVLAAFEKRPGESGGLSKLMRALEKGKQGG